MIASITEFSGSFAFLSNFYPSPVTLRRDWLRVAYPTVEHAFQAAKTFDPSEIEAIRLASTPGNAKRLGKRVTLRSDWESVKVGIMGYLLRQKFEHPNLRANLIATAPMELIEGNRWGDVFWGVCEGEGKNMLGQLLMQIRTEHTEKWRDRQ